MALFLSFLLLIAPSLSMWRYHDITALGINYLDTPCEFKGANLLYFQCSASAFIVDAASLIDTRPIFIDNITDYLFDYYQPFDQELPANVSATLNSLTYTMRSGKKTEGLYLNRTSSTSETSYVNSETINVGLALNDTIFTSSYYSTSLFILHKLNDNTTSEVLEVYKMSDIGMILLSQIARQNASLTYKVDMKNETYYHLYLVENYGINSSKKAKLQQLEINLTKSKSVSLLAEKVLNIGCSSQIEFTDRFVCVLCYLTKKIGIYSVSDLRMVTTATLPNNSKFSYLTSSMATLYFHEHNYILFLTDDFDSSNNETAYSLNF